MYKDRRCAEMEQGREKYAFLVMLHAQQEARLKLQK